MMIGRGFVLSVNAKLDSSWFSSPLDQKSLTSLSMLSKRSDSDDSSDDVESVVRLNSGSNGATESMDGDDDGSSKSPLVANRSRSSDERISSVCKETIRNKSEEICIIDRKAV